jgi:hypothetical protein
MVYSSQIAISRRLQRWRLCFPSAPIHHSPVHFEKGCFGGLAVLGSSGSEGLSAKDFCFSSWLLCNGCGVWSFGPGWWVIKGRGLLAWFSSGVRWVGWSLLGFQAPWGASRCLWSFNRLWVAVISRHSDRAADLLRRWKRSMRRLNLVLANTGSIIALRFR